MSAKDSKALVINWYEELNKGKAANMALVDKVCAGNCILHSGSGRDLSVEEYKKYMNELYNAFTDLHVTLDDMVAEGDKVAVRYTQTGTYKGEFMGYPPTNKKVTVWLIHIFRFAGGKLVEGWSRYDTLGMMQQLGLVPTPKKEK